MKWKSDLWWQEANSETCSLQTQSLNTIKISLFAEFQKKIETASTRILTNHILCNQPTKKRVRKENRLKYLEIIFATDAVQTIENTHRSVHQYRGIHHFYAFISFPAEEQHIDKFYYSSKLCAFHHLQTVNSSTKLKTKRTNKQNVMIWTDQQ